MGTALIGALFLHRWLTLQSRGNSTREVGWTQSSAMLVRREAAEQVGWLDPDFFVYSDETDFCKRLHDAGWRMLWVPAARAIHHDQLATDAAGAERRIVEFHRNRDLYMRKHHSAAAAWLVRWLTAWPYLVRALAAVVLPGHDPKRYLLHARQSLRAWRGDGDPRGGRGVQPARNSRRLTGSSLPWLAPCCYPLPAGRGAAGTS